ncbi:gliding motility-associated C-terminal domain-containing protein [Aquimarina aggregata]|uniref:T9SS type B sorting domain-containing protein n=1 Tax=Aquimarina aggregata TaxID=1642818 RepID=UPI00248F5FF0|nr:gliding motility-associated C-terminal domain-containing protein [Aquimarina aggregata]
MYKLLLTGITCLLFLSCSDDDTDNNNLSCCGEDALSIETNELPGDTELSIFNVITPNKDGFNDTFVISGLGAYPNNSIKIFDRGVLIFETENYHLNQRFGLDLIDQSFDKKVFTYELLVDNGQLFKANGTICAIKSSGLDTDKCNAFNITDPLLE